MLWERKSREDFSFNLPFWIFAHGSQPAVFTEALKPVPCSPPDLNFCSLWLWWFTHCHVEAFAFPIPFFHFGWITGFFFLNEEFSLHHLGEMSHWEFSCFHFFFIHLFHHFVYIYIFLFYNIILVLSFINMNPPRVYKCSPSWTPLPPPSPYHPSGSSQCTSPEHPVSCFEPGLAIRFTYDIIHVSMSFSQIIPQSPQRVQKTVLYIYVSFAVSHTGLSLPSF